jgi:hypothetical protein
MPDETPLDALIATACFVVCIAAILGFMVML